MKREKSNVFDLCTMEFYCRIKGKIKNWKPDYFWTSCL